MVRDACVGRPFSIVASESAFGTEVEFFMLLETHQNHICLMH